MPGYCRCMVALILFLSQSGMPQRPTRLCRWQNHNVSPVIVNHRYQDAIIGGSGMACREHQGMGALVRPAPAGRSIVLIHAG